MRYPVTPDGRYFLVKGTLWRTTNPALSHADRTRLTRRLMNARRAVGVGLQSGDEAAVRRARQRVNAAKIALGERGPVWWTDGTPDYNRHKASNTPYATWATQHEPPIIPQPRARKKPRGDTEG